MTNYSTYVDWRRTFHQYPELSDEEYETTEKLRKILKSYGIRILEVPLKTGLVAEIGQGEEMIAVRTVIDALPIEEQVKHEFTSKYQGAMHACGHDIHMASILATGIQLKEIEDELNGRVRLIFQPAEELGHGAFEIINTGVLKGAKAVLGFHNYPTLKVGEFAIKSGAITSAVDRFEFNVKGKGAHAAKPEQGNDPVIVVGQLINSLQTIVSRNLSAFDSANDAHLTQEAIEVAKNVGYHVSMLDEPVTIGEDFSGYTEEYPGVFAFIGSDSKYDLHHPKYHPDERILEKVPQYFVQLVQRLLT